MNISQTEENYLKTIYHLSKGGVEVVVTKALASALKTSPAAVADILRRLDNKGMAIYKKYQGVNISPKGKTYALQIIRKHRLWEVFLVEKLKFNGDEVHEVAENLEHIQSPLLAQRLDNFLGNPTHDPHGNPIPNAQGTFVAESKMVLSHIEEGKNSIVTAIKDNSPQFLRCLNKRGIYLGAKISVVEKIAFDNSMDISVDNCPKVNISKKISDNILVV
ncbi:MAG: metal-dependent transcriptional regulator [Cytophagales bacterium]|nr:metal-dependent transcriptional regulator [Cytophagales bacterium]